MFISDFDMSIDDSQPGLSLDGSMENSPEVQFSTNNTNEDSPSFDSNPLDFHSDDNPSNEFPDSDFPSLDLHSVDGPAEIDSDSSNLHPANSDVLGEDNLSSENGTTHSSSSKPDTDIDSDTIQFDPDTNQQDNTHDSTDGMNHISFKAEEHTAAERNAAINKAKRDIAAAESDIRHHTYMIKSKSRMGEPHSAHDSSLKAAEQRLADAKQALNDAYNIKVTTKS